MPDIEVGLAGRHETDHRGDHIQPSQVEADGGSVIVDGPGSVAVTMTPAAAIETSARLAIAAREAQRQKAGATPQATAPVLLVEETTRIHRVIGPRTPGSRRS